jgi:hypothetical protein
MDNMQLDRTISWGNIISWVVILSGLAVGYGKIATATEQNAKDVSEAKVLAVAAQEANRQSSQSINAQITAINVALAETRITTIYMDKKLDELIAESRIRSTPTRPNATISR